VRHAWLHAPHQRLERPYHRLVLHAQDLHFILREGKANGASSLNRCLLDLTSRGEHS
jgi:hypothetical protein